MIYNVGTHDGGRHATVVYRKLGYLQKIGYIHIHIIIIRSINSILLYGSDNTT